MSVSDRFRSWDAEIVRNGYFFLFGHFCYFIGVYLSSELKKIIVITEIIVLTYVYIFYFTFLNRVDQHLDKELSVIYFYMVFFYVWYIGHGMEKGSRVGSKWARWVYFFLISLFYPYPPYWKGFSTLWENRVNIYKYIHGTPS